MNLKDLTEQERVDIFNEVGKQKHISSQAIEKDWWVSTILEVLFNSQYKDSIVFKGGTSLSKAWKLISRFSEDIDIAIKREFLGCGGQLTKNQINNRLRRFSCSFVRENLRNEVEEGLHSIGIESDSFNVYVDQSPVTTVDPEKIYISYKSVFEEAPHNSYVKPRVIIEAGARSISDPFVEVGIQSFISETFPDMPFSRRPFTVKIVPAERTFLEKAFLLHEEFHKPTSEIRTDRMSRHLYDLEKMMDTPIAHKAIQDRNLYNKIVTHRKKYIGLKGFDYASLAPEHINFIPPTAISHHWKRDYQAMRENIIYGPSIDYETLIKRIRILNVRFNQSAMVIKIE
ncbi:MAG: nucleotidyl transferase AbiEii/AbiGii toxin family protein [Sphaerochaeta sp.]|nr:nucleotidyl transferase AbiEii/AbiGii toxin family protein [Sphaerochaeta sp.]